MRARGMFAVLVALGLIAIRISGYCLAIATATMLSYGRLRPRWSRLLAGEARASNCITISTVPPPTEIGAAR